MDTIVAVATPPGRSAIGIIRISGPQALELLRALVNSNQFTPDPNRLTLKDIYLDGSDQVLDSALVCYFQAPNSFTGEEMVEISCHGSPVVLRQILDRTLSLDARLAGPGEFTLRAVRNRKINLSQAEGIRDLINAQTSAAAQQATRQLKGELSNTLQDCKEELIGAIVQFESALEFVEDDLPQMQLEENFHSLSNVRLRLQELAATYQTGHLLREGIRVALVGRPNVGKSSVFNRLVKFDRAIVTELPGTTRDSLMESISLCGIPVCLTDTAGLREAGDRIEALGIERTQQAMADADLVVVVVDGSTELSNEDRLVLAQAQTSKYVIAINKADLPPAPRLESLIDLDEKVVHLSALTGEGVESLTAAIVEPFGNIDSTAIGLMITDSRHYDLLHRAHDSVEQSLILIRQRSSEELVLVGLHNALKLLGQITGETTTDDILGQIFSTFCIGK